MDQDEYMKQRVDDQIRWYGSKSANAKSWYRTLRVVEIVAAAMIPFLANYADLPRMNLAIGGLGILIAVIAGLLSLHQYQENWTSYRGTCESLRQEKFLFLTQTDPYVGEQNFKLLVQRVESLISKENAGWIQSTVPGKKATEEKPD